MNENDKRNLKSKMKWQQIILVLAIFAFLVGLGIVSAVSYFQTEQSFQNLNDPNIVFLGINFGMMISNAFSLLFQYGQNAILFIRKVFLDDDELFDVMGKSISQKDIALWVFFLFAGIDALTNCLWYYQTVEPNENMVLRVVVSIVGYSAMIVSVFVEEAIGYTLDALTRAWSGLVDIIRLENRKSRVVETPNTNDRNSNQNTRNVHLPPYSNQNTNNNGRRPEQPSPFRQPSPSSIPPDFNANRNRDGRRDDKNSNTDKFHTI